MVKKLPYRELFKRAWHWTYRNKNFWLMGLFISTGGVLFQYDSEDWRAFRDLLGGDWSWFSAVNLLSWTTLFSVLFALILMIGFWLLSLTASAAMIKVAATEARLPVTRAFSAGFSSLRRLVGLELLLNAPNVLLMVPVIATYAWSVIPNSVAAIFLTFFVAYNVMLYFFRHFLYCRVVLDDLTVMSAYRGFWAYWRPRARVLSLAKVWEIVGSIGLGLLAGVVMILLLIPLAFLGLVMVFSFGMFMLWPMLILAGVVLVVFLLVFKGAVSTLLYGYLTGVYLAAK